MIDYVIPTCCSSPFLVALISHHILTRRRPPISQRCPLGEVLASALTLLAPVRIVHQVDERSAFWVTRGFCGLVQSFTGPVSRRTASGYSTDLLPLRRSQAGMVATRRTCYQNSLAGQDLAQKTRKTAATIELRLAKPTRQPKDHPAQPGYWAGLGHLDIGLLMGRAAPDFGLWMAHPPGSGLVQVGGPD